MCKFIECSRVSIPLILLGVMLSGTAEATDETGTPQIGFWRTGKKCGLNTLYLLLRGFGHTIDYRELEVDVPIGPRGTSMLDLKRVAVKRGAEVEVYKVKPAELAALPKPLIAHLRGQTGSGEHYVLLLACENDTLDLIDGTTALRREVSMEEFRRDWDGYCLMRPRASPGGWMFWTAVASLLGATFAVAFWGWTWWKLRDRGPAAEASSTSCR
jgi:hypothetical protein